MYQRIETFVLNVIKRGRIYQLQSVPKEGEYTNYNQTFRCMICYVCLLPREDIPATIGPREGEYTSCNWTLLMLSGQDIHHYPPYNGQSLLASDQEITLLSHPNKEGRICVHFGAGNKPQSTKGREIQGRRITTIHQTKDKNLNTTQMRDRAPNLW